MPIHIRFDNINEKDICFKNRNQLESYLEYNNIFEYQCQKSRYALNDTLKNHLYIARNNKLYIFNLGPAYSKISCVWFEQTLIDHEIIPESNKIFINRDDKYIKKY